MKSIQKRIWIEFSFQEIFFSRYFTGNILSPFPVWLIAYIFECPSRAVLVLVERCALPYRGQTVIGQMNRIFWYVSSDILQKVLWHSASFFCSLLDFSIWFYKVFITNPFGKKSSLHLYFSLYIQFFCKNYLFSDSTQECPNTT